MAAYGKGQMLGSGINPESFKLDFSGFADAAKMQAQGIAGLGQSIGGAIQSYNEIKQERKKIDADTKASRAGIESAIKLGDSLGFDVKSMLSPVLERMDDPNTTPMEAAALGREASSQIANVLNLGFKSQDQISERAKLMQDAAYKKAQLDIAQQNANSRAASAAAAGTSSAKIVDFATPGGGRQEGLLKGDVIVPLNISGFGPLDQTQSSLTSLPDPLKPFAKDFETAGTKYGVAPEILAAIAMHETGNGTSSAFINKNNAMGVSDSSGPVKMGSVAESIDKMARLLGKGINEGTGPYANVKSISDIASIYAPPGAGNDPKNLNQFWTQGVTSNIEKLIQPKQPVANTPQERAGFVGAEEVKFLTNEQKQIYGLDVNKPFAARFAGDRMITTPEVPRTAEETEDAVVRNIRLNAEAKAFYDKGDRASALNTLRGLKAEGFFGGDLTDEDLDEYFRQVNPASPAPATPAPATPTPVSPTVPRVREPLDQIIPTPK
jgi:hypothetical protein